MKNWAINFNISYNALDGLLPILKKIPSLTRLPKDSRSILKTRIVNETLILTTIEPGTYYHFGLDAAIRRHFTLFPVNNVQTVLIVIGIDGLPISKSSSSQFWSILGYIRPLNNVIYPNGIYWGYDKPKCSNSYLEQFILESKELLLNGINIDKIILKVVLDGFCFDTSAKTFVLKIKVHTGFDLCTRCTAEGEYLKKRTYFPFSYDSVMRTYNDYITRICDEHHVGRSILNLSILPNINILVDFALDYMHLAYLGVMKKLIDFWIDKAGPFNVRLPSLVYKELSTSLKSLKSSIPCEFARKPRGLNEFSRFKATELCQLLIFAGQIIFKV